MKGEYSEKVWIKETEYGAKVWFYKYMDYTPERKEYKSIIYYGPVGYTLPRLSNRQRTFPSKQRVGRHIGKSIARKEAENYATMDLKEYFTIINEHHILDVLHIIYGKLEQNRLAQIRRKENEEQ